MSSVVYTLQKKLFNKSAFSLSVTASPFSLSSTPTLSLVLIFPSIFPLNHLKTWAAENNLKLNRDKTKEIVFISSRKRMPPPHVQVLSAWVVYESVASLWMTTSATWLCYCRRAPVCCTRWESCAHGIPATSLHDIFRATVVSRIQYAAPRWSEMCSSADHALLDSILRRSKRLGYSGSDLPSIVDLFNAAGDEFSIIKINSSQVL